MVKKTKAKQKKQIDAKLKNQTSNSKKNHKHTLAAHAINVPLVLIIYGLLLIINLDKIANYLSTYYLFFSIGLITTFIGALYITKTLFASAKKNWEEQTIFKDTTKEIQNSTLLKLYYGYIAIAILSFFLINLNSSGEVISMFSFGIIFLGFSWIISKNPKD